MRRCVLWISFNFVNRFASVVNGFTIKTPTFVVYTMELGFRVTILLNYLIAFGDLDHCCTEGIHLFTPPHIISQWPDTEIQFDLFEEMKHNLTKFAKNPNI